MKLLDLFVQLGYSWKIDGELRVPTEDDLQRVLDKAKQTLYDEPVPSQIEIGRLIIRRSKENQFETYLYIGDI